MSCEELQQEEKEVLQSIYDGDPAFKEISSGVFQYKVGDDGDSKSFIVEIAWSPSYPDNLPEIKLDLFYNKHLIEPVKEAIKSVLIEQANDLLGMSMTFTLFEWVKDNAGPLLDKQPDAPTHTSTTHSEETSPRENSEEQDGHAIKERKEHLTKAQKRKMFDRFGANSDRPRGWNWVDVVKHLAQTGGKKDGE